MRAPRAFPRRAAQLDADWKDATEVADTGARVATLASGWSNRATLNGGADRPESEFARERACPIGHLVACQLRHGHGHRDHRAGRARSRHATVGPGAARP